MVIQEPGVVEADEELAQDALVAALEQWSAEGIPDNPGAWLMTTAKHRAIDLLRKRTLHTRKEEALTLEIEDQLASNSRYRYALRDDPVGDDLLRLVFTACHPLLSPEARVALTLRLLGGLTTDEIARRVCERAMALPEEEVIRLLGQVMGEFGDRHEQVEKIFNARFAEVSFYLEPDAQPAGREFSLL